MAPNSDKSDLFSTFPKVSREQWLTIASTEINGKNPEEELQWTLGKLKGSPLYTREDLTKAEPHPKVMLSPTDEAFKGPRCWYNTPIIKVLDEVTANARGVQQLRQGVDGIVFNLQKKSTGQLLQLLESIEWPWCLIAFQASAYNESIHNELDTICSKRNFQKHELQGFYLSETYPQHPQVLHNLIHNLGDYKNFRLIGVQSPHEDGVDQVSDLLQQAVNRIDQLTGEGSSLEMVMRNLFFSVTIGTDFFLEIAKLKSLRWLWYQVVKAYGVSDYSPGELFIHARSKAWTNPAFEPHENMLKSTTAAMAAILGGCNALSIDAADEDERLHRIALNVSHILREESHLNKVADPTAGSYYIESLVHQFAQLAWEKFNQTLSNV